MKVVSRTMDKEIFNKFRSLIYQVSGISLSEEKEALVCARVGKRMRRLGLSCHGQYLDLVMNDESGHELVHLLNAISTNVTSFYRESGHFDFLTTVVQEWLRKGQRRFRFWSAACSTGAEPYTMAITLSEAFEGKDCDMKILATDINTSVLETAMAGRYSKDKIDGVPPLLRGKYFDATSEGGQTVFEVCSAIKSKVLFRHVNLSTPPFPLKGGLDAVFCRNVMIYFDNRVRRALLDELYRVLKPGGYLFVGHAESLTGMMSEFKIVRPSIYVKRTE